MYDICNKTNQMSVKLSHGDAKEMPVIGFGTWRCDPSLLKGSLIDAIRLGYRHIDTGPYKNESIVGEAIKEALSLGLVSSREELWITGKLATTCMSPSDVEPSLKKLLKDLGVEYLDLFITHWPYSLHPSSTASPPLPECRQGYSPERYLATWRALESCFHSGLVRHLGCSNMTAKKLDSLLSHCTIPPTVVQNELHPCLAQNSLLSWCASRGIVLAGYCPLSSPGRPDLYRSPGDPDVLGHPTVLKLAAGRGVSPAQIVLRWAIQRGTVPIPRSTNPARLAENFGALNGGWSLSKEEMSEIEKLDATAGSKGRIMKGVSEDGTCLHTRCLNLFHWCTLLTRKNNNNNNNNNYYYYPTRLNAAA